MCRLVRKASISILEEELAQGSVVCEAGKFAAKGTSSCTQCPEKHYTAIAGQTQCEPCAGKFETNNADFTGCQVDEALVHEDLIVTMFNKGVALSVSLSISAAFVFICGFMQLKREAAQEYIGQISRWQVIFASALSGFSFGSEVFLIFGIWRETQAIAGTMLVGRLLQSIFSHLCIVHHVFIRQHQK